MMSEQGEMTPRKPRTLIYPLFLPQQGCPFRCVYCEQNKISGRGEFDLAAAVEEVRAFVGRNPQRDKQVAFYGGTFTALERGFRDELLDALGSVCDARTSFRASTHPLYVDDDVLEWCAARRIRTLELGVQDFADEVLLATGRGYTGEEARAAVRRVRAAGFETGVQLMPGLPGWTESSLRQNREALAELRPHLLRLYPLIVIRGTPLVEIHAQGGYQPLSLEDAVSHCADYYPVAAANGIRIIKVGLPSNLAEGEIVAGPWHPAFGELVKRELARREQSISN